MNIQKNIEDITQAIRFAERDLMAQQNAYDNYEANLKKCPCCARLKVWEWELLLLCEDRIKSLELALKHLTKLRATDQEIINLTDELK